MNCVITSPPNYTALSQQFRVPRYVTPVPTMRFGPVSGFLWLHRWLGWLIGLVALLSLIGWQVPLLAVWTGIALAWQIGCGYDFYQLWQVLREPRSPDYLDTIVDDDLSTVPNITNLDSFPRNQKVFEGIIGHKTSSLKLVIR